MLIEFKVNGKSYQIDVCPSMRLIDLLRDELGLTGTKEGCGGRGMRLLYSDHG